MPGRLPGGYRPVGGSGRRQAEWSRYRTMPSVTSRGPDGLAPSVPVPERRLEDAYLASVRKRALGES